MEENVNKKHKKMIRTTTLGGWIWIHKEDLMVLRFFTNIKGKYLFFSEERGKLIELGKKLLEKFNLHLARVPDDKNKVGNKWVLCVYDESPRFEKEMTKYQTKGIFYSKWKSDEDTKKGKYSKKHLEELKKVSPSVK